MLSMLCDEVEDDIEMLISDGLSWQMAWDECSGKLFHRLKKIRCPGARVTSLKSN